MIEWRYVAKQFYSMHFFFKKVCSNYRSATILIYGCGELGSYIKDILAPENKLIFVKTQASADETFHHFPVIPVTMIKQVTFQAIIIASDNYESEMLTAVLNEYRGNNAVIPDADIIYLEALTRNKVPSIKQLLQSD